MDNGNLYTLWCKEKAPNDNLFVEISSTASHHSHAPILNNSRKNNVIANKLRDEGNKFTAKGKYHEAMACYNGSISYAENGTESLAFAIGNRSNCFFELNHFEACLIDIERAKNAGYPLSRISKLNNREQLCKQKLLQSNHDRQAYLREPKLDFDENREHHGVADCLHVVKNSMFGRHVVTARDLKIGQTVLVEKPFAFKHEPIIDVDSSKMFDPFVDKSCVLKHERSGKNSYGRCSYCSVECVNLIPCENCAGVLFCDEVCMKKAYHKNDCLMSDDSRKQTLGVVLRMLYRANDAFQRVEELMDTVKLLLLGATNVHGLPNGDRKDFAMIFRLPTNDSDQWSRNLKLTRSATNLVFNKVMLLPAFNEKFTSLQHQRFLKHLILHLFHVAEHAINASEYWRERDDQPLGTFRLRTFGNGMYAFGCHINHSCTPNVCWYFVDHRLICRVIRPIKKGSQLFGSYFPGYTLYEYIPHLERGIYLENHYFFKCDCVICSDPDWSPFSGTNLDENLLYQKAIGPTWMDLQEIRKLPRDKLVSYERDGARFLEKHERFHPVQATMEIKNKYSFYLQQLMLSDIRLPNQAYSSTDPLLPEYFAQ